MNQMQSSKIDSYTKYCCLFLAIIWCNYAFQLTLNIIGGTLTWIFVIYVIINIRKRFKGQQILYKDTFVQARFIFYFLYAFVYFLGRDYQVQYPLFGIKIAKQLYDLLFLVLLMETMMSIAFRMTDKQKETFTKVIDVIIFTVALGNIAITIINPDMMKKEADEGGIFVLGYGMSYVLALMCPLFVYKIMNSPKGIKEKYYVILLVTLFSVYRASFFIANIAAIMSIILSFVLQLKKKSLIMFLSFFILPVAVLVFSTGIADVLTFLAENTSSSNIGGRLADLSAFSEYGMDSIGTIEQGSSTVRIEYYLFTFVSFLKHPILGNYIWGNYKCSFDHCTLLDFLSCGGIILGGVFINLLNKGRKFVETIVKDKHGRSTLLSLFVTYIFLTLCNSVLSYSLLGILFFVTTIYLVPSQQKKNENINSTSL